MNKVLAVPMNESHIDMNSAARLNIKIVVCDDMYMDINLN